MAAAPDLLDPAGRRRLVVQWSDYAAMKELKMRLPDVAVGLLGQPGPANLPALATWADQVNPHHWSVDRGYVDAVHRSGLACLVWTVDRAAKAAATAPPERRAPDPVARARRLEERLALMDGGIADFALWLGDLMRGGTAAARHQPYAWWDGTAARLVDAQLPGLAEQVRAVASEVRSREDWAEHLLTTLGRW